MFFFFFNQKTAYEMRISDWSSDVCSSDLRYRFFAGVASVENLLMPAKKYVIFYRPDPSNFEKAGELFPAHVEHYEAFQKQGTLLSFGPFEDIVKNGSMGIFTTMEAAEEFIAGDPFVQGGVVATHEVREWNDAIG